MALGKIKADTLEHSTAGSIATNFVVNGSAKAWGHFDNDKTVDDSLNTSSLTDTATGKHTVNFANSMSSVNYCMPWTGFDTITGGTQSLSTSSCLFHTRTSGFSFTDKNDTIYVVHGDLA